jgi:hypothetical protein|tara:strand:- start:1427 stop:1603 length:177 start_codon:yes stop_codon:yes gene_type:complete
MLTQYEWEQKQHLFYDVMPNWWWNPINRIEQYESYVRGVDKWHEEKRRADITGREKKK